MQQSVQGDGMRVAIIGGGVIGCLTALFLHRLGAKPVIIERGCTGQEASWAGAGILCPIHPWLYPDSLTHFVEASLSLYPDLSRDLKEMTGQSIQWQTSGLLIPLFAHDKRNHCEQAMAWSERFGWKLELLSGDQARLTEPTLSDDVTGALLWPEVGQLRNPRLLKAIRAALEIQGIEIREQCEVTDLIEANGQISGLRLKDSSTIDADAVLLAAGSWSGELAKRWGIHLSVEPVKGQIVLLKDEPGKMRHIIKHDDAYFVPREDGRVLIGASMEHVGFERGNTTDVIDGLMQAAKRIVPGFKDAEVEHQWMGFRPGTPDGLPLLGPVNDPPGLWVATGHYRNGVVLAPGTADLMSRWITGQEPDLDMDAFRVDRCPVNDPLLGFPESD